MPPTKKGEERRKRKINRKYWYEGTYRDVKEGRERLLNNNQVSFWRRLQPEFSPRARIQRRGGGLDSRLKLLAEAQE
jgi:hypothetical protein